MKKINSETISLPVVERRRTEQEETVEVTLYDTQRGREVVAVHRRDDERLDSYSFRVVDKALQMCAYRDQGDPPVGVLQAVERFGYHVKNAGSHPPEYADFQLVSHTFNAISTLYSMSSDPLLCGFLSHAIDSVAVGVSTLGFRTTIVDKHDEDAFDDMLDEMIQRLGENQERKEVSMKISELNQEFKDIATDGGYLTTEEFDSDLVAAIDDPFSSDGVSRQRDPGPLVDLEVTDVNGNRMLFVTVFYREHVDRYTFDVIDSDAKTCVIQRGNSVARPPPEVIDEVNDAGYEIKNVSIPQADEPLWRQLADAGELLDDVLQSYKKGRFPYEPLDRGQNTIQDATAVAVMREVMEPMNYRETLVQAIHTSPLVKSADELESFPWFSDLDDFFWKGFYDLLSPQTKQEFRKFLEERNIF